MDADKHILYISYNGLLEEILGSQVVPYIRELAKKGYGFTLLTFEKRDKWNEAGKEEINRIKNELKEAGIDWHGLRYHKRISLLAKFFDVFAGFIYAVFLFYSKRIRIVHARSVIPAVVALMPKLLGARFIFDTRGLLAEEYVGGGQWENNSLKYKIVKFWEKIALMAADEIVVLTEKHRKYLLEIPFFNKGKNRRRITVIPCCVDLSRFRDNFSEKSLLKEKNGLKDKFIYLYLGKIGTHYMMREMVDFFSVALEKNPDSRFVILTQSCHDELLAILEEKKISPDKVVIKKPYFHEIPSLISVADAGIFFISPYKKFGSSPIKLGEFLSCSIPVIINKGVGDTEELVRENKVGVVIEGFERVSYDKAIREFLELIKEGDALGQRCRKTAMRELSLELGVERYNAIYERVLKCTK